jgi:hypothetical protein
VVTIGQTGSRRQLLKTVTKEELVLHLLFQSKHAMVRCCKVCVLVKEVDGLEIFQRVALVLHLHTAAAHPQSILFPTALCCWGTSPCMPFLHRHHACLADPSCLRELKEKSVREQKGPGGR